MTLLGFGSSNHPQQTSKRGATEDEAIAVEQGTLL